MLKKCHLVSFFLFTILLGSCASHTNAPQPISSDLYWSQLSEQALKSKFMKVLSKENTALFHQIEMDAKDHELLNFWGQSFNFDSGAKKKILPDQLISELHAQFGLRNDNYIVHAGITHTYGYLFSTLNTPYGFKRKRWIDPTLNFAFGFNGNSLSPETIEGGLLSNVTYFSGMLAFKNHTERDSLKKLKNVSSEVRNFDYNKVTIEQVEEEYAQGGLVTNILRTTLVKLPFKKEQEENDYLLIYSIYNFKTKKEVLITSFPIKRDAYTKITAAESMGVNQAITLRYNAALDGANASVLKGLRKYFTEAVRE